MTVELVSKEFAKFKSRGISWALPVILTDGATTGVVLNGAAVIRPDDADHVLVIEEIGVFLAVEAGTTVWEIIINGPLKAFFTATGSDDGSELHALINDDKTIHATTTGFAYSGTIKLGSPWYCYFNKPDTFGEAAVALNGAASVVVGSQTLADGTNTDGHTSSLTFRGFQVRKGVGGKP